MRFIFLLMLIVSTLSSISFAEKVPYVDENDPFHTRRTIFQTHTGFTQTEFHGILPRLKVFRIKVQKIQNDELVGPEIQLDPALEVRDPKGVLHNKLVIFHLDNLEPNTEYYVKLLEVSQDRKNPNREFSEDLVTDTRIAKTLDPNKVDVQFTAASCLCDEDRYNDIKFPIWTQKRLTKPDFATLIGDITYVDSFDFVRKPDITVLDIWQRHFASALDNPMGRMYRMIPLISTWDDHDSSNNSNKYTPTLAESLALFNLIYGGRTIPGVIENGPGTSKWFKYGKTDFAFLDGRTFREKFDTPETGPQRYGNIGKEQEDWFFEKAYKTSNLILILKGEMMGSETITEVIPETGKVKRITESWHGDHPLSFKEFSTRLQALPNPTAYITGDIHRAQFIRVGPSQTGARWNPYPTAEWTVSPLYSYRYNAQDPDAPPWPDKDRYAHKNIYNFGLFKITHGKDTVKIDVEVRGDGRKNPDGSNNDWRTLAKPYLTDSLVLKNAYTNPNRFCSGFYSRK